MIDIIIRGSRSQTRERLIRKQACCYAPEHSECFKTHHEELPSNLALFCFSHIRWDLVFQRSQHLMSRWAKTRLVFFVEEPVIEAGGNSLKISRRDGVTLLTPHIKPESDMISVQRRLLSDFISRHKIRNYISWYLSPMFLPITSHLNPEFIVYDCINELSGFGGASTELQEAERHLFALADLVFTGGLTLYEAKSKLHPNIHAFPSSIDFQHFSKARLFQLDPLDQRDIPNPRIGYYGVLDERMDQELVDAIAEKRPDWHWIFVGPVLNIDQEKLPRRPNIHYLGKKDYRILPSYMSGWDVAVLPFARNDATRFISPAKTPEYLAAGRPVVSTSICDVVRPYGERGLVCIADDPASFINGIEKSFTLGPEWLSKVDAYLWNLSWDQTWNRMNRLLAETFQDVSGTEHSSASPFVFRGQSNAHV